MTIVAVMKTTPLRVLAAIALAATATTACSTDSGTSSGPAPQGVSVAAAFYPLAFVAESIVGDLGSVTTVTPPGVEPHDVELSPAIVREMQNTDIVLYISGFQPAVDDAIESTGSVGLDASAVVGLHAAGDRADDEEAHGDTDPHFWLDPALLATYALAVGDSFAQLDPAHGDTYLTNAADLADELNALADSYATTLSQCTRRDIIVSHEAFGYLTEAFDLNQVAIAGVDPQSEPSPAKIREIRDLIAATGSTTVFTESLVNPAVAESLAADAGVATAVLDPVETVVDGDDYLGVMNRNLDALREALDCG
jgi:zinc transport system substrate-binding protein